MCLWFTKKIFSVILILTSNNVESVLSCTLNSNSRYRVVQLCSPASPHIKKSFEGISMYELVGGYINKYFKYADPTNSLPGGSKYDFEIMELRGSYL